MPDDDDAIPNAQRRPFSHPSPSDRFPSSHTQARLSIVSIEPPTTSIRTPRRNYRHATNHTRRDLPAHAVDAEPESAESQDYFEHVSADLQAPVPARTLRDRASSMAAPMYMATRTEWARLQNHATPTR
ncbi:hypothetical protein HMN09_00547600 [Mycena chlorophos]|uniref:Uncharacterized protein n=1 Tax=Mycena chlorophos TaxID=658473 RepID=A0A8H6TAJ6_MYCCL|nr:hypothetical protein HMN09_00547600 [Mycena chlorophos]